MWSAQNSEDLTLKHGLHMGEWPSGVRVPELEPNLTYLCDLDHVTSLSLTVGLIIATLKEFYD